MEKLIVKSRKDILDYCRKHGLSITRFNHPVIIPEGITICDGMFAECTSFNQPTRIPSSVKCCEDMFYGCLALDKSKITYYLNNK